MYGTKDAIPQNVQAVATPRNAFAVINDAAEQLSELLGQAEALTTRLIGPGFQDPETEPSSPQPMPDSVLADLGEIGRVMTSRIARIRTALSAIERHLP